ncbi:MAG: phage holin family protein [Coriobacteriia bacterium]|nr:phage holin family protein [Coriobacteriia bacterium]
MKFIIRMLISAAGIFGIAYLTDGALLQVDSFWPSAVLAAVVLALVNAIVRPIVKILALPVTVLTLGFFSLVISAAMLYIVAWVVPGFTITGFWQAILSAVIIAIITSVGTSLVDSKK